MHPIYVYMLTQETGGKSRTPEGTRVAMIEKSTGRVIAGMAAPLMNHLVDWIIKNPSFQVLLSGNALGCRCAAGW